MLSHLQPEDAVSKKLGEAFLSPRVSNTACMMSAAKVQYPGGKAKRFTAVYNGKRRYAAVKRARYHSILRGIYIYCRSTLNTA